MARPTKPGKRPAVLVCHGGGGYADMVAPQVVGWAKRGYVSICQDQPGICNRLKASSTGPCMEKGSAFQIVSKPQDSTLFDGVAAALNGLSLLRSQPDVDKSRVGVTGGSWGGYMTTMVSGLARDRLKAAFSVYGCGYYDVGSAWMLHLSSLGPEPRRIWLDNLDAGRRAKNIKAAYFIMAPANDWYFWPSAVMRTYADIPGAKNICFTPNDSHALNQPGGTSGPPQFNRKENRTYMEVLWLEHYLRGKGQPFPRASAAKSAAGKGNSIRVEFTVTGPAPITASTVWYAAGELPWRLKWWAPVPAKPAGKGRYAALIPIEEPDQPVQWFGLATDERYISVSTLIQDLDPKKLGFKAKGYPVSTFRQDFEDKPEHKQWRRKYADRRPGRHRICSEAARTGKLGLELRGAATFACWGLRAATLKRSGATKIRFWIRAAKEPCPMPVVDLLAERADGKRYTWKWASAPKDPIGPDWRRMEVHFDELKFAGKQPPDVDLLSPALGQLRFTTKPETHVYIDDIEAL